MFCAKIRQSQNIAIHEIVHHHSIEILNNSVLTTSQTVIDLSLSLLNCGLDQVVVLTVEASAKLKIKRTLKYQHLFFMFIECFGNAI